MFLYIFLYPKCPALIALNISYWGIKYTEKDRVRLKVRHSLSWLARGASGLWMFAPNKTSLLLLLLIITLSNRSLLWTLRLLPWAARDLTFITLGCTWPSVRCRLSLTCYVHSYYCPVIRSYIRLIFTGLRMAVLRALHKRVSVMSGLLLPSLYHVIVLCDLHHVNVLSTLRYSVAVFWTLLCFLRL